MNIYDGIGVFALKGAVVVERGPSPCPSLSPSELCSQIYRHLVRQFRVSKTENSFFL